MRKNCEFKKNCYATVIYNVCGKMSLCDFANGIYVK